MAEVDVRFLFGKKIQDVDLREKVGNFEVSVNSKLKELEDIINPFNVDITIIPATVEKGSIVTATVNWTYNKSVKSQSINDISIPVGDRTKKFIGLNTNTVYTLKSVSDGDAQISKSVGIYFYNGIYYGKSSITSDFDSAFITSLSNKVLSDARNRTINVTAGGNEYIYYCIPTRLGEPTFNVGGFDGGFNKVATIAFRNPSAYSESYDIWRSTNANLGTTTIIIK